MASISCPECENSVSETAKTCRSCGFAFSPEVVAKDIGKQRTALYIFGIGCLGFMLLIFLRSGAFTATSSSSSSAPENYTPAQMVTYLDRHDFDTTATAQMQQRLARLSRNYGLNEFLIADRLVRTQELLASYSVRMTLDQIADSVEAAAPRAGAISIDELLAAYVTLRSKNSNAETIAQLRGLLNELGLGKRAPSGAMKRRFRELGIASAEVGITLWGVNGFLHELTKKGGHR